jgi:3-oxoacyl-[acyl-carrier protein] reductase
MDLQLGGKTYIVTGGSRGLGFAAARALVDDGARVVLSARHEATLRPAVEQLGEENATAVVADLADPAAADRLVDVAMRDHGRLDGALISVGGPPAGSVLDTSDEDWAASFQSVFVGAVRLCRVVVAALTDGGSLALVLSTSVKAPIPDLAISNGLRPGLGMVVKTLADEVGPRGIRVNGLMPGRVNTERLQELDSRAADPEAARRENEQRIPLRRQGEPDEFGRVAAFLLSPASSYVTGALVPVDGGQLRPL